MIKPIDTTRIERWSKIIPELLTFKGVQHDGQSWFMPWDWGYSAIAYRPDRLQVQNPTFALMIDPQTAGKVGMNQQFDVALAVGGEIADSALNPAGKDVGQLLDEAESRVFEIAEAGSRGREGFKDIHQLLSQVMERVDMLYHRDNPSDITGIPTGFHDLDQMTSGLQEGELVVVAGRPSMGKTAFALNVGEHVAVEHRLPVAVFSMDRTNRTSSRVAISR